MPRPSRHTDRLLIEAAKSLVRERGVSGLKVREAARKARVNLGMFHYHFKSKEEFVRRVLLSIYEEFYADFKVEASQGGPPLERLRRALISVARFARRNRPLALTIIAEVMRGHKPTVEFAAKNLTRHIAVVVSLVGECRRLGLIPPVPLPQALFFLAGSVLFPTAAVGVVEKAGAAGSLGLTAADLENAVLSDAAIEQRVDWALRALRRRGTG